MITGRWTFRCVIARLNRMRPAPCGSCTEFPPAFSREGGPQGRAEGIWGNDPGVLGLTVRSV